MSNKTKSQWKTLLWFLYHKTHSLTTWSPCKCEQQGCKNVRLRCQRCQKEFFYLPNSNL